jgi:DNA end-binding protein Ku
LRQAIAETGRVALSRVVIGQREKTIALRSVEGGIVAHTLDEQRDINDARPVFGDAADIAVNREMVQLAKQLIERQTNRYDPSDLEDRYETRLRAMIEAKLKGEGIETGAAAEPDHGNVVDLMAALKKSVAQAEGEPKAEACRWSGSQGAAQASLNVRRPVGSGTSR